MKLAELVKYLIDPELLDRLYNEEGLDRESEALLIYMKRTLDLESEIRIFEIEETEDDLVFEKGGIQYIQLFSVDHVIDLIKFDLDLLNKGYSNTEIAKRILEYRERDA